jgi:hypothetical protein
MNVTAEQIIDFKNYLITEERSIATVEKYIRDACSFFDRLGEREADKAAVIDYKSYLSEKYLPSSYDEDRKKCKLWDTYQSDYIISTHCLGPYSDSCKKCTNYEQKKRDGVVW